MNTNDSRPAALAAAHGSVTVDDLIAELEVRGLGWSLDNTGRLIEALVWDWPYVIGRYRPNATEPLAKMLAEAMYQVDWTRYPAKSLTKKLGVLPFHVNAHGFVEDATGSRVLACSEDTDCLLRFNERAVDSDGHFMCPNCGRLGQRMVEARPEQCGLTPNDQAHHSAARASVDGTKNL